MKQRLRGILLWFIRLDGRVVVPVIFALFFLKSRFTIDPDFGWHLASGEYILAHGIPRTDVFTYTATDFPWIHHEWLADIANYLVHSVVGYTGLALMYAAMWTLAFWLVARTQRGKLLVLLAVLVALPFAGVRAVTWTVLLLALLIVTLRQQKSARWLWVLPTMLLWVNVHGSFVVGLVYIGYHALSRRGVYTYALLAVAAGLTLVNPYGVALYTEVLRTVGDAALHTRIGEWKPFQLDVGLGIVVGLWLAARILIDRHDPKRALLHPDVVLFLLVFTAARHIPLFALASLPVIQSGIGALRTLSGLLADARIVALGLILVVASAGVLVHEGLGRVKLDPESAYPRSLARTLVDKPCVGNLFNDYNDGGYLIWRVPGQRVFIDGRMPSWRHGDADYFAAFERILTDEAYQKEQFDHYAITCVLASDKNEFGARLLQQGWQIRAKADGYALFERSI